MRTIQTMLATLGLLTGLAALGALAACGKKASDPGAAGSADVRPAATAHAQCPPGNVVKEGACVAVMTADKITAVVTQQTRLDDLAKLLDQVETVAAPIELFDGIRQLDQWQALKDKSERFTAVDAIAGTLNTAVKTLRTFRAGLGETSARLADLKTELDQLMVTTGAARQLTEVRAAVSSKLRAAVEPLTAQVMDAIQNAVAPLTAQLSEVSDLVITGCTMAKLSGGGDKLKELCGQAKEMFTKAVAFVDDVKARPAQLFNDVTSQLTTQLDQLVDAETQKLVATAQGKVSELLKLPPAGSSSAGSASGSAK
jgi:hypothetical protein